ncbi:MAG: YicC/YloC family endoribonuclease [Isosphaeraceae bacterium]|nr:YicC/YloC family endoribonuclease [Isosphaeraceae bacterium]
MLLSMTGFGEARRQNDRWSVLVELRAVNNRHLKLSARFTDPYGALEPEVERLIRESVRRGTVQFSLRVERPKKAEDYRLNLVALASYRAQIENAWGCSVDASALLGLPGIVEDRRAASDTPHDDWPEFEVVIREALAKFQQSRAEEGRAMGDELIALGRTFGEHLERVAERGPDVVSSYQRRLTERVQNLVKEQGVAIEAKDLIREVAIFAERADIAEEVIRLRAHLVQYAEVIGEPESAGRKLEFVVQEMGRETNTIGSKANDLEISRSVVEMKGILEKIRELIQNVE